jgi:hypothetical protein
MPSTPDRFGRSLAQFFRVEARHLARSVASAGTGDPKAAALEQCQEKHAPDHDPGWKPVFRPTLRKIKDLDA